MDAPTARSGSILLASGGPRPSCQNCAGFGYAAAPAGSSTVVSAAWVMPEGRWLIGTAPVSAAHKTQVPHSGQSCVSSLASPATCISTTPNSPQISIHSPPAAACPAPGKATCSTSMNAAHIPASRRNSPARQTVDMKRLRGICYKILLLHLPLTLRGTAGPLFDVCQINLKFPNIRQFTAKRPKRPSAQPFSSRRKASAITPAIAI